MDIDTLSFECLSKLPHEDYRFKVITIEHDYYLYGDKYRQKQRDLLAKFNYKLICSDVLVPPHFIQKENCAFEDWWVDYQSFLWPICGFPLGREMGEAYWRAFKKLKLGKGELTALAQKLNEVDSSGDSLKREEAVRVFTAFLVQKGVWAGL
jgi:hypothetical protein